MNGRHSKRQVLKRFRTRHREPCLRNHLGEPFLRREAGDGFDQILVGITVGGDDVAQVGDHLERVGFVNPVFDEEGFWIRDVDSEGGRDGKRGTRAYLAMRGFVTLLNSRQLKTPPGLRTR